jgi:hypothetical protein
MTLWRCRAAAGPVHKIGGVGFALVSWTPALERHRKRDVSGVARESGGIEWNFGRRRGPEI